MTLAVLLERTVEAALARVRDSSDDALRHGGTYAVPAVSACCKTSPELRRASQIPR
jgi:hypothetical protein